MANPFLNKTELMDRDIETALLLEKAIITDIGRAVAYTDGTQVFINTEENLTKILPAYDQRMLKWLLWHEKIHIELNHADRYFRYIKNLKEKDLISEFQLTQEEVNIIMDILVHDSMQKMFPELVETAVANLAQIRNRNSLSYTFKTFTLEKMLNEYKKHKSKEEKDSKPAKEEDGKSKEEDSKSKSSTKPHGAGGKNTDGSKKEDKKAEIKPDKKPLPDEHSKTDWSKLEKLDSKEFITASEADDINEHIKKLKRQKFKLIKITETLNGLVTSTRKRSYVMPSLIHTGGNLLLKGSTPGRSLLYLIFDASGSMSGEMKLFKEIISKSIPQAMNTPCEWFSGSRSPVLPYNIVHTTSGDKERLLFSKI